MNSHDRTNDDCHRYWRELSATIGSALAVFTIASAAHAEPEAQILPDTVVSANRVAVPSSEVGSSVTVITGKEMEERQIRIVADALRDVPGVSVNRTGPRGLFTQVRIRGNEGNHTKVFIDGVEANDPSGDFEFDFANLLAADIERVEIIRGPQSALWGSDAIGGVINVITKRGASGMQANGYLEAGSFDTFSGNAALSGAGKNYRYFAGGSFFKTQGVNMSRTGQETDGYKNGTLNLSGAVDPTDSLELSLNGTYIANNVESDPQDFTSGMFVDGDRERIGDQFFGRAQGKMKTFDGQWEHILGGNYTYTDFENRVDKTFSSTNVGTKSRLDYQSNLYFSTPSVASADHTVTLYAEYAHETFKNDVAGFPQANQEQSLDSTSVAGEYLVGLWERIFVTGSLRHDNNDRFKNATTYRFTGAYVHPESGSKLHGSVGTGIKNPGFFDLFGFDPSPTAFVGNPNLNPEESSGWDLGYEQQFFGDRLVMDLTYFRSVLTDEITLVPLGGGLSTVVNQPGKSNRQGVEWSGKAVFTNDLSMSFAYTWTEATDPDGSPEVRRPEHIASLVLNYLLPSRRGNVNLNIQYNGSMQDFDFSTFPATRRTLDSYTLVNLAGAYNVTKTVQLFGRIENLLDEDYEEVFSAQSPGIGFFAGVRVSGDLMN